MKYWEVIADNLHKAGRSLGWVSAIDSLAFRLQLQIVRGRFWRPRDAGTFLARSGA
jgi:hypothetical protein